MTPGVTDAWTLFVIAGLAGVTVLTRCFFFILDRAWPLPAWGAPGAAVRAGGCPGRRGGAGNRHDQRPPHRHLAGRAPVRRAAGAATYFASRSVLVTLLLGMAVTCRCTSRWAGRRG